MRLLLDTHIPVVHHSDRRLSSHFRESIESADVVFVSVASIWEAIIKYTIGKLPLPEPPFPWLATQRELHGFVSLPVEDPFDRMLVAQAIAEKMVLVSKDQILSEYPVEILW